MLLGQSTFGVRRGCPVNGRSRKGFGRAGGRMCQIDMAINWFQCFNVAYRAHTQSYVSETILGPIPANGARLDWLDWSFTWIFRKLRPPTTWYHPWGLWYWSGHRSRVIKWQIWCRRRSSIFSNIASKEGLSRFFKQTSLALYIRFHN